MRWISKQDPFTPTPSTNSTSQEIHTDSNATHNNNNNHSFIPLTKQQATNNPHSTSATTATTLKLNLHGHWSHGRDPFGVPQLCLCGCVPFVVRRWISNKLSVCSGSKMLSCVPEWAANRDQREHFCPDLRVIWKWWVLDYNRRVLFCWDVLWRTMRVNRDLPAHTSWSSGINKSYFSISGIHNLQISCRFLVVVVIIIISFTVNYIPH